MQSLEDLESNALWQEEPRCEVRRPSHSQVTLSWAFGPQLRLRKELRASQHPAVSKFLTGKEAIFLKATIVGFIIMIY